MKLRALELEDVEKIYAWENDPEVWECSLAHVPFSRYQLTQFVLNASGDIYADKQLRLVAEIAGRAVGCVDLFDYDPFHHRAEVGILVDKAERGKGFGRTMLEQLETYARERLQLHQLYGRMEVSNEVSQRLFSGAGYKECGRLEEWQYDPRSGRYGDVMMMQKLLR